MTEMRSLFEALGVLGFIIATSPLQPGWRLASTPTPLSP